MVNKKKQKKIQAGLIAFISLIVLTVLIVFYVPVTIIDEDRGGRIQEVPKTLFDLYKEQQVDIEIPPPPQACITLFAPVCGNDIVTYSNACEAGNAGVSILHEGACLPTDEPKNFFEQLLYGD